MISRSRVVYKFFEIGYNELVNNLTTMDVKSLILEKVNQNGQTTSREIMSETGYSRAYVNRFLRELRDSGQIVKLGKTNRVRYVSADKKSLKKAKADITHFRKTYENKDLSESDVLDTLKQETGILQDVDENIVRIFEFGFTEMLNNAIDHSGSESIRVEAERKLGVLQFRVGDWGIGIFQNILEKHQLDSPLDAIRQLLKGKQTTMPERHTGEGIFFTSKLADALVFRSGEKKLLFNNRIDDVFISDISEREGTYVQFSIDTDSEKQVQDVFSQYTDEDTYEFSDTEVTVHLYQEDTDFISRSQARRIVTGLDKFKRVVLDFSSVESVGQAFADEIFRVWKRRYPEISIIPKNMHENVEFMVDRAQKVQ
jgi:anti-sigma regulatory factor (Ser/Thr protein kinase)/predicted transcriptional regulator